MAALIVLSVVLAYWTWSVFSPRPVSRSNTMSGATGIGDGADAANRLFGNMTQGSNVGVASGSTLILLGVVAAPGTQSGYAVMRLDAKRSVAVREGGEIEPGVRLLEVHADHVVLERSGKREPLAWITQGKDLGPDVRGSKK